VPGLLFLETMPEKADVPCGQGAEVDGVEKCVLQWVIREKDAAQAFLLLKPAHIPVIIAVCRK
jgi:hypothetical protein